MVPAISRAYPRPFCRTLDRLPETEQIMAQSTPAQQQQGASQPAQQQQGQSSAPAQQQAQQPKPVFRDWASI